MAVVGIERICLEFSISDFVFFLSEKLFSEYESDMTEQSFTANHVSYGRYKLC